MNGLGFNTFIYLVIIPALAGIVILFLPKKERLIKSLLVLAATLFNLIMASRLFGLEQTWHTKWGGLSNFGIDFALRTDRLSMFILLAVGIMAFLVAFYSVAFLRDKDYGKGFYFYYLITIAFVNGAVLANNLVLMLFFWEGLLVTLFGMLLLKGRNKYPTAVKALTLVGVSDLALMLGVGITGFAAGTLMMDKITAIPIEGVAVLGFVMMMLGAIGKAGSMPFHSWIPDAADDAPLPFMAILPGALEKLLGIYLLVRICMSFYDFQPHTTISTVVMAFGALTIIFAVAMALIQKDFKRLLSYHAISQVGYMVLGIGTALPIGIVGGLFHMVNNAIYKSCLFLSAGAVERQTGTTDLKKISGLGAFMPVTMICFLVAALSISGFPPFNGFFSKELVFDAAMESGIVFYIAALLGAFMTAASFLKLGHAAFFGKTQLPEGKKVKEAPAAMLVPMIILAATCLLFGVWNSLPLGRLIQPAISESLLAGHNYAGWPHTPLLVIISILVLALAIANHIFGVRRTGKGLGAVDHIHYAPGLHFIYNRAEERWFDPYDILIFVSKGFAWIAYGIDRAIDWIYDGFFVRVTNSVSKGLKEFNTGKQSQYIVWAVSGMLIVIFVFAVLVK